MIYMVQESSDSDSYGSRPSLNSVPESYLLFAHRKKFEQFLSNVDFYDNFSHGNKLQYRYGFVGSATLVDFHLDTGTTSWHGFLSLPKIVYL